MTHLAVAATDSCWPLVLARGGRALMDDGMLEKLKRLCDEGQALCLASLDGVIVVTAQCRGGRMRAVVLLAVSTGSPGAFRRQERAMVEVARELDAEELCFTTRRRGWARLLGPQWRFDGEMFVRSVS